MNQGRKSSLALFFVCAAGFFFCCSLGWAQLESQAFRGSIYKQGKQAPIASRTTLKAGDKAPDFELTDLQGNKVRLSDYAGKENVVISFLPAAWTAVCSNQWPGYNLAKEIFQKHDAVLLGITVDNVPTLFAWTKQMGELWFPVLSDFWPHGEVAKKYGVLRDDGVAERALFVIDKEGVIRYVDVHDINSMPRLENLVKAMAEVSKK